MSQVSKLSQLFKTIRENMVALKTPHGVRRAFTLPINKICRIPVRCEVKIAKTGSLYFVIYSSEVSTIDGDADADPVLLYGHLCDNEEQMAEHIFEVLPKLKFDRYNSKLVTDMPEFSEVEIFGCLSCATIGLTFEECCVCSANTKYKTGCGHTLCVECCGSIKRTYCEAAQNGNSTCECEGKDCGIIRCPICRQSVEHY